MAQSIRPLPLKELKDILRFRSYNGIMGFISRHKNFPKPISSIRQQHRRIVFNRDAVVKWFRQYGQQYLPCFEFSSNGLVSTREVMEMLGYTSYSGFFCFLRKNPDFPQKIKATCKRSANFYQERDVLDWLNRHCSKRIIISANTKSSPVVAAV